ncbi:MAG: NAD(P)-binding domain-containing protein [Chloroflexi bacterium]|nr:NAD(P)-binding domain-containing protein [Chloroflexota bacterium]
MTIIYQPTDADMRHLRQRRLALVGYGNLGRSFALNLRDSGLDLMIGNIEDKFADLARNDGFQVKSIAEAATDADTLLLIIPDEVMPQVYLQEVAPHLRTGDMLVFASGYNVTYGFIEPPAYVDAGLIAPRTLGVGVRDGYLNGLGYPCYLSVGQDHSGNAWDYVLALAAALGALHQGALEVSFNQEVEVDLFLQQAVLPALHHILLTATEVLVREGYPPEVVLTELYLSGELGLLLSRSAVTGWSNTLQRMSPTGQYSLLSRTNNFQETKAQRIMVSILDMIRDGDFAQEWSNEYTNGYPRLNTLRERYANSTMWRAEREILSILRGMDAGDIDDQFLD